MEPSELPMLAPAAWACCAKPLIFEAIADTTFDNASMAVNRRTSSWLSTLTPALLHRLFLLLGLVCLPSPHLAIAAWALQVVLVHVLRMKAVLSRPGDDQSDQGRAWILWDPASV